MAALHPHWRLVLEAFINAAGQVAGSAIDEGSAERPVTWKGRQLIELGALGGGVPRGDAFGVACTLEYATNINAKGAIVAVACDYGTNGRSTFAFRLTPS